MIISQIIKQVVDTKGCVLIRPRKEDHIKGDLYHYDVKEAFQGNKKGWTLLDLFTASAMLKVYEALNKETNRYKFDSLHINTLIDFTWKHIN